MKISHLVDLKCKLEQLLAFSNTQVKDTLTKLSEITNNIDQSISIFPFTDSINETGNELVGNISSIETNFLNIEPFISTIIKKIDVEVERLSIPFLESGYIINDSPAPVSVVYDNEYAIRVLPIEQNVKNTVTNIARGYTDWHYPTLEIGPGRGDWTDILIAGDPLYIVDIRQEYIDVTLSKFNDVYRRRIRPYIVKRGEGEDFANLSNLPQGQFGFIFSWNVFNYFTLPEVKSYLRESYELLRPGGVMMFSYNNCDIPICAYNVEVGFKAWMTKNLLIEICTSSGFEIINTQSVTGCDEIHWVEIKRPGKLRTVKAHQALGKILPIGS